MINPAPALRFISVLIIGVLCSHCTFLPEQLQSAHQTHAPKKDPVSDIQNTQPEQINQLLLKLCLNLPNTHNNTDLIANCQTQLNTLTLNTEQTNQLKTWQQQLTVQQLQQPLKEFPPTPLTNTNALNNSANPNTQFKSNGLAVATISTEATLSYTDKNIDNDSLITLAQQYSRQSKWLQTQQLLNKLKLRNNLTSSQLKKIQTIKQMLTSALDIMDQHAEQLYQNKRITDAQAIWAQILQITPEQQDIRNKYQRAKTVLDNIKVLREKESSKTDTQLFKQ